MKAVLSDIIWPSTEEQLRFLLEQTFEQLTGAPLASNEPFFVFHYLCSAH
jgi:hypothetical protein